MLNEARVRPVKVFDRYLRGLPEEIYDKSESAHIVRLIMALCGDAGAGSIRKQMLLRRLETALDTTDFIDLDRLFGSLLRLPRKSDEVYEAGVDPHSGLLTEEQWASVRAKDAAYRKRISRFLEAIAAGGTLKGIQYAAEAALGVECRVYEAWRYYIANGIAPGAATTFGRFGTANYAEVIVIPLSEPSPDTEAARQEWRRQVYMMTALNKPQDAIISTMFRDEVSSSILVDDSALTIAEAQASSEMFRVKKLVTARSDWSASYDGDKGFWLLPDTTVEAPVPAYQAHQEEVIDLTSKIADVVTSSDHIGEFHDVHSRLYRHLRSEEAKQWLKGISALRKRTRKRVSALYHENRV